jgi:hypothetical protein
MSGGDSDLPAASCSRIAMIAACNSGCESLRQFFGDAGDGGGDVGLVNL